MLALLALTLGFETQLPTGWQPIGAVLTSKIVSRESVGLPQDAVVDLDGKYVYSQNSGKRWEIDTGKERRCIIEGDQDYEIPRRWPDSFRIYFDRVHNSGSVFTYSTILYAKGDVVVAHIAGGGASSPSFTPTLVVMQAGGPPVHTATQAQLAEIPDTPAIWTTDIRPHKPPNHYRGFNAQTRHLEFSLLETDEPTVDLFYRHIPLSLGKKPDISTQLPKGIKPLNLPRNGIDWEAKRAYAASVKVPQSLAKPQWVYEFSITKPMMKVRHQVSDPVRRDSETIGFFGRLRDGTLARSFWGWKSTPDLPPILKDFEGRPLPAFSTYLLDPQFQKWTLYKGLMICGTSTDGRYVAYATPPWRQMRVAEVTLSPHQTGSGPLRCSGVCP